MEGGGAFSAGPGTASPGQGGPRACVKLSRDLLATYGRIRPELLDGDVFYRRGPSQLGVRVGGRISSPDTSYTILGVLG